MHNCKFYTGKNVKNETTHFLGNNAALNSKQANIWTKLFIWKTLPTKYSPGPELCRGRIRHKQFRMYCTALSITFYLHEDSWPESPQWWQILARETAGHFLITNKVWITF